MIKLNTETFIEKAILIHGKNYDYDTVIYKGIMYKIKIKCKIHGVFEQSPREHLKGQGCRKCKNDNQKLKTDEFVYRAKIKHNSKYYYNNAIYTGNRNKVIITCPIHGDFEQNAGNHLNGQGCNKCSGTYNYNNYDYIKKAIDVHDNIYDYNLVLYKNANTKIKIICKKHGLFEQRASSHLEGVGCPKCKNSKGENTINKILLKNNIKYKYQYSFNDLKFKNKLYFDFGLLDHKNNIIGLIEFNGEQHYEYCEKFHKNKDNYKTSILKDNLKIEYCLKNKIPLFIIKYNENINDKMNQILNIYNYE